MKITKKDLVSITIFIIVVTALYVTIGHYLFSDYSVTTRIITGAIVGFIAGCSGIFHRMRREKKKKK